MSSLRNPIVRTITRQSFFDKPPIPRAGYALVVLPPQGQPFVVSVGGRLRNADFKAASMIYEVDLGEDSFAFSDKAPSANDTYSFQLDVEVSYAISDPIVIVQRNIKDTRSDVQRAILTAVTSVSREHDPDKNQLVQQVVRMRIEGEDGAVAARLQRNGYDLKDVIITVRRDTAFIDHTQTIADIQRKAEIEQVTETLREVTRMREKKEATHIQEFLAGDPYKRLSYYASLSPQALEHALSQLSAYEFESMRQEMVMMGEVVKDLEDHQKQKLFNQLKQHMEQRFASSHMLQAEDVKGSLPDSRKQTGDDAPARTGGDTVISE